jgi:hypothetical protein
MDYNPSNMNRFESFINKLTYVSGEYRVKFSEQFNDLIHEAAVSEGVSIAEILRKGTVLLLYLRQEVSNNQEIVLRDKKTGHEKIFDLGESALDKLLKKND